MKFSLYDGYVFGSGAELWCFPQKSVCYWSTKFDWLVDFQIHAASKRFESEGPLFISSPMLPSRLNVLIEYKDTNSWARALVKLISDSRLTKIRVYCPKSLSFQDLKQALVEHKKLEKVPNRDAEKRSDKTSEWEIQIVSHPKDAQFHDGLHGASQKGQAL